MHTGFKISASLDYVTVRGKGMVERAKGQGGSKTPYALSLSLPPCTSASWTPMCVFVTVNEAQRYFAKTL
jgi:hypothetical protein